MGGMEAAASCAEFGHEVILCEKSDSLGGAIKCEVKVPFKQRLGLYIDYQKRRLESLGLDVRLNTEVTPDYAKAQNVDIIIASTGATPAVPPIPGMDEAIKEGRAYSAEEIYIAPEKAGETVAILGAGLVGLELALYLAQQDKKVQIIEMQPEISHGGNILHAEALLLELKKAGAELKLNTKPNEVTDKGTVLLSTDRGTVPLSVDTVVYATGMTPHTKEALALTESAPQFHLIGDSKQVGNIANATFTARGIAMII
jgi:NADPH-dependent 2,4-dienoyl-CoA reductase/sulfur reductase-like enzyme